MLLYAILAYEHFHRNTVLPITRKPVLTSFWPTLSLLRDVHCPGQLAKVFIKGYVVNIFDFVVYMVSVTTTQDCHYIAKAEWTLRDSFDVNPRKNLPAQMDSP